MRNGKSYGASGKGAGGLEQGPEATREGRGRAEQGSGATDSRASSFARPAAPRGPRRAEGSPGGAATGRTVQGVPAGQIRRVTGLSDAQISTIAQTARCLVMPVTSKAGVRNRIAEMLRSVRVGNPYGAPVAADRALGRIE